MDDDVEEEEVEDTDAAETCGGGPEVAIGGPLDVGKPRTPCP